MIETLRAWIVNISTVVLFITAVEMLLPDNSLKKYSKFVLGLILITVLINPLIKYLIRILILTYIVITYLNLLMKRAIKMI